MDSQPQLELPTLTLPLDSSATANEQDGQVETSVHPSTLFEHTLNQTPGTQQEGTTDAAGDADDADDAVDLEESVLPSRLPRGGAALSPGSPRLLRTLSGSSSCTTGYTRDAADVVAKGDFNGKISVGEDYQCLIPTDHAVDREEEVTRAGTTRWCPIQAGTFVKSSQTYNGGAVVDDGHDDGASSTASAERQQLTETGCDVASFLKAAKEVQPSRLIDELMSTLHDHQYDSARALDTLQARVHAQSCSQHKTEERAPTAKATVPQHVLDVESLDNWTEHDKEEFTDAVLKYGKDFSKIHHRVLPSRTVPQLILHYYLRWKGTPQFFEWQEQSLNRTNEDECAAPHCPWASADSDGGSGGRGGGGGLLCCDGCPQAFHFSCCEPKPLSVLNLVGKKWYCTKCTATRRRWGRQLIPCSDDPARHDCSPCGGRGEVRLLNDTKMMPPAPVMQYKSLSCNPRCKHCIQLLAGTSGGINVGSGGNGGNSSGRRRSGRQAAVTDVNVFRGAGLNVREPITGVASSDGTESDSDNVGGAGLHSDSSSDELQPRARGRHDETQTDEYRSSDSADDEDEARRARHGRRKRKRTRQ